MENGTLWRHLMRETSVVPTQQQPVHQFAAVSEDVNANVNVKGDQNIFNTFQYCEMSKNRAR